jgi:hypothetical protein
VSSVQCPSGDVCYQGDCRRACEPGREGASPCNSDADCTEAALPNCVVSTIQLGASFCSTCDVTDTCVPEVGICQPVVDIPRPEQPQPTTMEPPPLPLDGGFIDGSVFGTDAGPQQMVSEITHVGTVELRQIIDLTGGTRREYPSAFVQFDDVRTGTVVQDLTVLDQLGQCEIVQQKIYSDYVSADVGDLRISADPISVDALQVELEFNYDMNTQRYVYSPAQLPSNLLTLSRLDGTNRYVRLFSAGLMQVTLPWPTQPPPPFPPTSYHLPFRLDPDQATVDLLSAPIVVMPVPQDLSFAWEGVPPSIGFVGGESVRVAIFEAGSPLRLRCQETEGFPQSRSSIDVPSALIDSYRSMVPAGAEHTITLERVFEQTLPIEGNAGQMIVIDATLVLSNTFVGTIRF